MSIVASIGGLNFSIDDSDSTLADMQGWYGGAPKRVKVVDRPNQDSAFDVAKDYRTARVITVTGLLNTVSADLAITDVWPAFAGLQADGVPSEFTVTDALGALSSVVSVEVNDITPLVGGLASYVLQMVARDSVKYGPAVTQTTGLPVAGGGLTYPLHSPSGALYYGSNGTLGRVTLTNVGTAETWPKFTVTGGLTAGFFIQRLDTGAVLRYDRVVPVGSFVTIDSRTGAVLIDGQSDGSTYLTRDELFAVPAMGSIEVQFNAIGGSTGTPTMDAIVRSGWR